MVVPISPAPLHILALVTVPLWLLVLASPTKTWSLCSFIQLVGLFLVASFKVGKYV